jgi:hypothetical protein
MRNYSRGSAILAGRAPSQQDRDAKATRWEANSIASRVRQGLEPICAHDHVAAAVRLDPSLDNAARDAVQQAGIAACQARQIAAYVADPPTTAPAPSTGP